MKRTALALLVLVAGCGLAAAAVAAGGGRTARAVPQPRQGATVVIKPTRGVVLLQRRGHRRITSVDAPTVAPVGSLVDVTRGAAELTAARGRGVQTAAVAGGRFSPHQGSRPLTQIRLRGERPNCASEPAAEPRELSTRTGGSFVVLGAVSAASPITGSAWVTTDECGGTRTRVRRGAVAVARAMGRSGRRRAIRLFGRFRTRGRCSAATVRGRVVVAPANHLACDAVEEGEEMLVEDPAAP